MSLIFEFQICKYTVHGICVLQKSAKYIQSKPKILKKLLILRVKNLERSAAIVDSDSPSLYLYIGVNPLVLLSNLTFTQNIPHPHRKNRKNIWLTLEKLRTA